MLTDQDNGSAQAGISLSEYGLVLGLIALLSIGALTAFGGSVSSMFWGVSDTFEDNNVQMSALQAAATGNNGIVNGARAKGHVNTLKGEGFLKISRDPATGEPVLRMVDGAGATSATSVDGAQMNSLGSFVLAQRLSELSAKQSDPAKADYYRKMAHLTYYLGAAEGEMDEVEALNIKYGYKKDGIEYGYSKGNALRDIAGYSVQLKSLMETPPANLDAKEFRSMIPLAADAFNIAHNYTNAFGAFLKPDGSVPTNFGPTCGAAGCALVGGTAGSVLAQSAQSTVDPTRVLVTQRYDQLVNIQQVKTLANRVLADHIPATTPVKQTFTNAVGLDSH